MVDEHIPLLLSTATCPLPTCTFPSLQVPNLINVLPSAVFDSTRRFASPLAISTPSVALYLHAFAWQTC